MSRWWMGIGLVVVLAPALILAQDDASPPTAKRPASARPRTKNSVLPMFTSSREAAALTFAQEHLPELARTLKTLKDQSKGKYRQAIREIFQESERLADIGAKDENMYQAALKLWQIGYKIDLLSAKMKRAGGSQDPAQAKQLERLLGDQLEWEIKYARNEVRWAERELDQKKTAIDRMELGRDKLLSNRLRERLEALQPTTKGELTPTQPATDQKSAQETKPETP